MRYRRTVEGVGYVVQVDSALEGAYVGRQSARAKSWGVMWHPFNQVR
jgi:hypothetical protein